MKKFVIVVALGYFSILAGNSQVLLSGGLTYNQNFDSLPVGANNTTPGWTDNSTLPGWYASRAFTAGTTSAYGPYSYSTIRISAGSETSGWLMDYGTLNSTDRAIGSLSSGTPKTNVFGVLFKNDTSDVLDTVTVSYTGEQWRNGGNTAVQQLAFSYLVSPVTLVGGVLAVSDTGWTGVTSLNFLSPTTGATAAALDGNLAANRTVIPGVVLTGLSLNPGEELFLRWLDIDDSGNDHGLAVDDLSVSFAVAVPEPATGTLLGLAALGMFLRARSRS